MQFNRACMYDKLFMIKYFQMHDLCALLFLIVLLFSK